MVTLGADAITDFVQQMASVLAPAISGMKAPKLQLFPRAKDACCEIPEVDCPPRCVCEITWDASAGEELNCTIRVRNASQSARTFTIEATQFAGPGNPTDITVSPTKLDLKPGASGVVSVSYTVPEAQPQGDYYAEIVITGSYEQCVEILLHVLPKQLCPPGQPHCFCEVVQGEPPVRIRAHHWYDHFQCTEPCFTPPRDRERTREPASRTAVALPRQPTTPVVR
jgi:hypothetical protein